MTKEIEQTNYELFKTPFKIMLEKDIEVCLTKQNNKYQWSIQYMGQEIDSFETNFYINNLDIKNNFIASFIYGKDKEFKKQISNKIFKVLSIQLKKAWEKEYGASNENKRLK